MIFLIKIRYYFVYRQLIQFDRIQKRLKQHIISKNKQIPYLKYYKVEDVLTWDRLPLVHYDQMEKDILKLKNTKENTICSEKIVALSKSSGTTSSSKWIPVSNASISKNYQGGFDMLSLYFHAYPKSKILNGKNFSLIGSYTIENGLVVGDVSALILYYLPKYFCKFRTPNIEIAAIPDWDIKLEKLIPQLANEDIRWIAGVPSWVFCVIERLEAYCNKPIIDIWPNFEVFFYGGTSIAPFRNSFLQKFHHKINFWQVYNASEGFLGVQMSKEKEDLVLLPNKDLYYEFKKFPTCDDTIYTASELQFGEKYELIISNKTGLYRYQIGDVIEITGQNPINFKIVSRTKCYINTFGEELMIHNVESAIEWLGTNYKGSMDNYTIAPIILNNLQGYHRWYIESNDKALDILELEHLIDQKLQELNSDYAAKRYNDLILKQLKIEVLPVGTFKNWLLQNNKMNAQSKIPKMWPDTSLQEALLLCID